MDKRWFALFSSIPLDIKKSKDLGINLHSISQIFKQFSWFLLNQALIKTEQIIDIINLRKKVKYETNYSQANREKRVFKGG